MCISYAEHLGQKPPNVLVHSEMRYLGCRDASYLQKRTDLHTPISRQRKETHLIPVVREHFDTRGNLYDALNITDNTPRFTVSVSQKLRPWSDRCMYFVTLLGNYSDDICIILGSFIANRTLFNFHFRNIIQTYDLLADTQELHTNPPCFIEISKKAHSASCCFCVVDKIPLGKEIASWSWNVSDLAESVTEQQLYPVVTPITAIWQRKKIPPRPICSHKKSWR